MQHEIQSGKLDEFSPRNAKEMNRVAQCFT